jgi:hypothetical protein
MEWTDAEPIDNRLVTANKQFFLAVVMEVKRGAPHIGTIHNILDGDCIITTLADQLNQGFL